MASAVSIACLLILVVATSQLAQAKKEIVNDDLKIVCYYSNWAIYRPGLNKFTPQNINPYLCTHIIYAFAGMSKDFDLKPFDAYNDIEQGNFKKFVGLKSYNPKLKTLIAIGGWNEGSKRFSKLVSSYTSRQRFVRSAVRFLRQHNFDGLDLDWEYPGFRDGASEDDKVGYAQLMKELRVAFEAERVPNGKDRLLLSVAVPAGKEYIDGGFDIPSIAKSVDFLNVLTYDYHTAYESETHHHAPLRARDDFVDWDERNKLNIEWTMDYYIQNGAPKHKLIVGIPTYGRSYTLQDAKDNDLESPTDGPGEPGAATREKGYLAYYEICQKIKDEEWTVERPYPKISGPYAYGENQWVGYDDEEAIIEKVRYILDKGLGGAMVWTLDNDDFRGNCGDEQSPLINTIRTSLLANAIDGNSNHRNLARAIKDDVNSAESSTEEDDYEDDEEETTTRAPTTTTKKPSRFGSSRRTSSNTRRNKKPATAVTPAFTTPEPPPTPDPGPAFECSDEGFYNNPKDCKKYFWCLDSGPANLGIVPHAFSCPAGLFFNSRTEACDYPENVVCKLPAGAGGLEIKKPKNKVVRPTTRTTKKPKTTTEEPEIEPEIAKAVRRLKNKDDNSDISEVLRLLKELGGVQGVRDLLAKNETEAPTSPPTLPPTRRSNRRRPKSTTTTTRAPATTTQSLRTTTQSLRTARYRPPFSPAPYKPATADETDDFTPAPSQSTRGVQFQRRPQFSSPTTTTEIPETPQSGPAIFNYVEPNRSAPPPRPPQAVQTEAPGFQFVYQTPGRTLQDQDLTVPPPEVPAFPVDDIFSYQTPARAAFPTTAITLPPPREVTYPSYPTSLSPDVPDTPRDDNSAVYRVPIRVQGGGARRVTTDSNGRRRARVRVKAGSIRPLNGDDVVETVSQLPDGSRVVRRRPVQSGLDSLPRASVLDESRGTRVNTEINRFRTTTLQPSSYDTTLYYTTTPKPPTTPRQNYRRVVTTTLQPLGDLDDYDLDYYQTEPPQTTTARARTTTTRAPKRQQTSRRRTSGTTRKPVTQAPTAPPPPAPRTRVKPQYVGPSVTLSESGELECRRRGVFVHPKQCGIFVVCTPTRSKEELIVRDHHCPADHIFLEDVGRCMRGDKLKCEVKL